MLLVGAFGSTSAAVFDESPTAGPNQAYYGNWGVDADAQNPAPNSYNNFRKVNQAACPSPANCDLAQAVADDDSVATWSNTSHPSNPLKSPGMFIGQSPSTTSYEDNVFFLGGLFDFEGGGKNGDSSARTEWDFRVGFVEDPDEFVIERQPNDESWDLWAGEWYTDGVSLQLVTGATDDEGASPTGSSEQYVRANGKGIVLQGAGSSSALAHEGQRDGFGVGVQTTAMEGFGPEGLIEPANAETSTSAGYSDNLDIRWWMDPVEGSREVTMYVNVGEVIYQQNFDPGSADDPKTPNPTNDPNNSFSDGFFDWQNATPVLFVGAIGGTADGTGQMGFYNPNPGNGSACDFDGSGVCDLADLDELMYTGLNSGDPKYDLNNSGTVDLDDRDAFLDEIGSLPGDANNDGITNAVDLNALGSNWQRDNLTSWAQGDFDGNGVANAADLNVVGNNWQKTAVAAAATAAVPEPTAVSLLLVALTSVSLLRRRPPPAVTGRAKCSS